MLFALWNVGVVTFIMYRVKGDDLDELEREAMEKLEFEEMNEKNRIANK